MSIEEKNIRYILFLIDSKIKQHDGKIFCNYIDAKEYAASCIEEKYSDKAVIGMFYLDTTSEEMLISSVETIGFQGDKKNIYQLDLFK